MNDKKYLPPPKKAIMVYKKQIVRKERDIEDLKKRIKELENEMV